ncbi:replication factor C subunit 3-like isoform X2 [Typha latifolia]|uniref:replication factor C subunit 3-like isoform X2 n=1 Tax=Typha latifolia TaxID=4733 RepID=UPI003C2FC6C7
MATRVSASLFRRSPPSRAPSISKPETQGTLSSALVEERLRESTTASPYYAGLLNSGLYLRSLAGANPSRSSSCFRNWGASCFSRRREAASAAAREVAPPPVTPPLSGLESWDPGLLPRGELDARPLRENDLLPDNSALAPAAAVAPTVLISRSLLDAGEAIHAVGGGKERQATKPMSSSSVPKEREFVWAQKYRPRVLREFICNRDQAEKLNQMVAKGHCGHYIFEGPPGVGKKTMVIAYLRGAFGPGNLKIKNELKKIDLKGEHATSVEIRMRSSSHHVEVNISELHGYEKNVIIALINETLTPAAKAVNCDNINYRVIVLHEADKLSTDAQHYIRWLMEKYEGCNRIFFCCSDASKLQVVKNLCNVVKLLPPSVGEIVDVLEYIAKQEHIDLPHHLARRIAENSKKNLRQAIRSFEASCKSISQFIENQEILTGWEEDIANIAKNLLEEQSPRQLYIIRGKLKNVIEHNVSPDYIFDTLIAELKKNSDGPIQAKINTLYQDYNNRGRLLEDKLTTLMKNKEEGAGKKFHDQKKDVQEFMRIEEFTAKFMSFYKSEITKNMREKSIAEAGTQNP